MLKPCPWTILSSVALMAAAPASETRQDGGSDRTESASAVKSPADWQALTRRDIQAFADALRENYIYASYPEPARWRRNLTRTLVEVEELIPRVHDARGYQALLRYMGATFRDTHVGTEFKMPPIAIKWPGFLVRFDNGRYRIVESRISGVVDGAELTACDGKPVAEWIRTIAHYEVGAAADLETSRLSAALRLLVDRGSPLRRSPSSCTVAGRNIRLDWQPTSLDELMPSVRAWLGDRKPEVSTRMVDGDGAWVKLGYFAPSNAEQAAAFHAAIAAAPALRDKRFIVLDVRGNGGGPYNWFMGYLRGLYGAPYADHYATARLRIHGVYRLSPAYVALDKEDAAEDTTLKAPADPTYEANDVADGAALERAKQRGDRIFKATPLIFARGAPPPNPVRAKVFVLTDYGCASACIGLVDEMKRFPDVRQIGLPTYVDSRSGTSVRIALPGGYTTALIAAMTRDGRERGDNVPHVPAIRFTGDIRDDIAVEQWVVRDVVKGVAPR